MPIDRQEIETVFTANLDRLERATIRYGNRLESMYARAERAQRRSNRAMRRQADALSRDLRRAVAGVAIGIAAKQILEYEEAWRNTRNTIQQYSDVLGPALEATSDLNAVANDAGVPMAELGNLTGAAARAAKDLGRSRSDVLAFVESVSKGASLANNGAAAVTGAFTQLSQAIASPRVQLQEFNSVVEGTPRLAQAFADGVDGAGGSVAKLREEIASGNVSGGELFAALLSQADKLRAEFETLEQGPTEAINRLSNKLIEYVGTNDVAINSAQGLAQAINWVADNLDTLTDAMVIGAAALTGFLGAQATAAAVTGLANMTSGATGMRRAIVLLNAVMQGFGGPLVIGATLVAGALAAMLLQAGRARTLLGDLESSSESAAAALEQTARYVDRARPLERIGEQADGSVSAVDRLAASISGVTAALQDATVAQFLNDLTALQQSVQESRAALEAAEARIATIRAARSGEGLRPAERAVTQGLEPSEDLLDARDQARRDLALVEQRLALAYSSIGAEATAAVRDSLLGGDVEGAFETLRQSLVERFGEPGAPAAAVELDEDALKAAQRLLDDIQKAMRATFETERAQIERVYAERLKQIDSAALSQAQADQARLDAELVYQEQLKVLRAEEEEAAAKAREAEREARNSQLQLVAEVEAARDAALGRTLSLLERETEARRAQIEAEISDEALRLRALEALEEEHQAVLAELRANALSEGREFTDDRGGFDLEIERVQEIAAERIAAIEAAYGAEIELHREAQAQIVAIQIEALERIQQIQSERLQAYLSDAQSIFGNIGAILKNTLGEQNDATKAFLAIQKGLAFAELAVSAAQGISKAIKVGFPQNIPLIVGVTAQVAQATAILKGAKGFQSGGFTGRASRDDAVAGVVHANEYVMDAPFVRQVGANRLDWLRRNPDALKRLRGYKSGGLVTPASFSATQAAISEPRRPSSQIDARAIFNGPVNSDTLPDLAAMLERQRAEILERVPDVAAQDVARGGGALSSAIEQAYSTQRVGA